MVHEVLSWTRSNLRQQWKDGISARHDIIDVVFGRKKSRVTNTGERRVSSVSHTRHRAFLNVDEE